MIKPMLAGKVEDLAKLGYPVFVSQKLDGIRCMVQGGKLVSRNLKPIPNKYVQMVFAGLPDGLDGELIAGDPLAEDCFRVTTSAVMREDDGRAAQTVAFYVFDKVSADGFTTRLGEVQRILAGFRGKPIHVVPHKLVHTPQELLAYEAGMVGAGAEGVMVRHVNGPYKQGRSTAKEGWLLKLKRFEDSEARIVAVHELMHNDNEATTNALGHTERSSHQENLRPGGTMGKLEVVDQKTGVQFEIGTGYDAATRLAIWDQRKAVIGKVVKYKFFPGGVKDKPRFPVFLGFRSQEDMS